MSLSRRAAAEFFGTFWLVFGGVGSAVIASKFLGSPELGNIGIGFLGVAFAFGLTLVTMAYAIGPISGAHLNPAVSIGLWAGGRFPARDLWAYVLAQVVGAVAAAGVLYAIASGAAGFTTADGFGSNGYGAHSPGGYSLAAVIVAEVVLTLFFLLVIHGATDRRAPAALAPLAIGLTLTLIHLISIPVDNTSVNPARSLAPALFVGGWALSQLWVFIVFPIVGGAVGGLVYRALFERPAGEAGETAEQAEVEAATS
jgi:aquaporin Z